MAGAVQCGREKRMRAGAELGDANGSNQRPRTVALIARLALSICAGRCTTRRCSFFDCSNTSLNVMLSRVVCLSLLTKKGNYPHAGLTGLECKW